MSRRRGFAAAAVAEATGVVVDVGTTLSVGRVSRGTRDGGV